MLSGKRIMRRVALLPAIEIESLRNRKSRDIIMAEIHVLMDTPNGDRVNVKTQADNPTQARTLALAQHPNATVQGIMNLSTGAWVEPDPERDDPLPSGQIPDQNEQSSGATAQTVVVDSKAERERFFKSFAPSITVGAVLAAVFLSSALFSVDMSDGGGFGSLFGAMEVTAFEIQSHTLGMTLAYPIIGLYLIAILCSWFAHLNVMAISLASTLIYCSLGAVVLLLVEAAWRPVLDFAGGDFSIVAAGYWVQMAFCVVFGIWAFTLESRNPDPDNA